MWNAYCKFLARNLTHKNVVNVGRKKTSPNQGSENCKVKSGADPEGGGLNPSLPPQKKKKERKRKKRQDELDLGGQMKNIFSQVWCIVYPLEPLPVGLAFLARQHAHGHAGLGHNLHYPRARLLAWSIPASLGVSQSLALINLGGWPAQSMMLSWLASQVKAYRTGCNFLETIIK